MGSFANRVCLFALAVWLGGAGLISASAQNSWEDNMYRAYKARLQRKPGEAERFLEAALAQAKSFGPRDMRVAETLSSLAGLYTEEGRFTAAEKFYKQALFITEKALGPEHPDVATIATSLAHLYLEWKRFDESKSLFKRAETIRKKNSGLGRSDWKKPFTSLNDLANLDHSQATWAVDGREDLRLAQLLNNVAGTYEKEGRFAKAEPLYERSLRIAEKILGPEHPYVATIANGLGRLYRAEARYADAVTLFQRSLTIREKTLGPEHPSVADTLNNLAEVHRARANYAEAEALEKRSLAIFEKSPGPEQANVAPILNSLARLNYYQGRYKEAETLYHQSLSIAEKTPRPENQLVAITLENLAALYFTEGEYAKAEPVANRARDMAQKILGTDHPDLAPVLQTLARLKETQGKYDDAESLLHQSLTIQERPVGPEHPDVAQTVGVIAELNYSMGKFWEAEVGYRQALMTLEKVLGAEHPEVAVELNGLAMLYSAEGRYSDAEPLLRRALTICEKVLGPESPDLARALNNLADLYLANGEYAKAEPLLQRSLALLKTALGPGHAQVGAILNNLAGLHYKEGRFIEAERLYQQSLAIAEAALGPEHPDVARSMNNLAAIYRAEAKDSESERMLKRALAVQEKMLFPGHPDLNVTLFNLALLSYARDQTDEAGLFFDRTLKQYAAQLDYLFPYMTERERLSFLETWSVLLPGYYSFCFKYGQRDPALLGKMYNTVLSQKGFVGRSIAAVRSNIVASSDQEALNLLDKLTTKRSQLASALFSKAADATQGRQNIDQLTREANDIEGELLKRSRALADGKKLVYVSWQDVQRSLKAGDAAVELVKFPFLDGRNWSGKTHYVALIITPETRMGPVLVQLGDASELEGTSLLKYRALASEHTGSAPAETSVYHNVWKPIEDALGGAQTVYLSPDGVLNLVAFPVIPIGNGRRLVDKYDIRMVSSTREVLNAATLPAAKSAVLIGDPRFELTEAEQRIAVHAAAPAKSDAAPSPPGAVTNLRSQDVRAGAKLAPLPASKAEIESIRSLLEKQGWRVESYTGEQATEEAIKHVQGPRVLHVATHAFFLKDQAWSNNKSMLRLPQGYEDPMLRSGLFFTGAGRVLRGEKPAEDLEDGILSAYEATGLNLQGTELVVLSACETGRGQIANGEGVFGLRRALQEAGARAVLMSLWSVPDRETQELMTLFYSKWLAGADKQQALREAELELRAKVKARYGEDRPFYWGGFVLVGR